MIALVVGIIAFMLLAAAGEWLWENVRIHKLTGEEKREIHLRHLRETSRDDRG